MFRARDEVEERVRETREAWQGGQAEMMKTLSDLQGTEPDLHVTGSGSLSLDCIAFRNNTLFLIAFLSYLITNDIGKLNINFIEMIFLSEFLSVRPDCLLQTNSAGPIRAWRR